MGQGWGLEGQACPVTPVHQPASGCVRVRSPARMATVRGCPSSAGVRVAGAHRPAGEALGAVPDRGWSPGGGAEGPRAHPPAQGSRAASLLPAPPHPAWPSRLLCWVLRCILSVPEHGLLWTSRWPAPGKDATRGSGSKRQTECRCLLSSLPPCPAVGGEEMDAGSWARGWNPGIPALSPARDSPPEPNVSCPYHPRVPP